MLKRLISGVVVGLLAFGFLACVGTAQDIKPMNVSSQPAPVSKYTTHEPIRINNDSDFDTQFPGRIISGYDINGSSHGFCIYVGNCSIPFTIKDGYLHNASGGASDTFSYNTCIFLYSSSNASISGNTCFLSGMGIYLYSSSTNTLNKNNCSRHTYAGIYLSHFSNNNLLSDNICFWNSFYGIRLDYYSANNIIIGSNCIKNIQCGINLFASYSNTFTYNNLTVNGGYGVEIYGGYNRIYHNNFINNNKAVSHYNTNHVQANDPGNLNFWNDSSEGNYWSDWNYYDNDTNGIVDGPYLIDGTAGARDYFPLTTVVAVPEPSPLPLIILSIVLLTGIITRRRYQ